MTTENLVPFWWEKSLMINFFFNVKILPNTSIKCLLIVNLLKLIFQMKLIKN